MLPLDGRRDEIMGLAAYLLARRHRGRNRDAVLEASTASQLQAAQWPGNLRQLDAVVCQAYALAVTEAAPPAQSTSPTRMSRSRSTSTMTTAPEAAAPAAAELMPRLHRAANSFVGQVISGGGAHQRDVVEACADRCSTLACAGKVSCHRLGDEGTVRRRNPQPRIPA